MSAIGTLSAADLRKTIRVGSTVGYLRVVEHHCDDGTKIEGDITTLILWVPGEKWPVRVSFVSSKEYEEISWASLSDSLPADDEPDLLGLLGDVS
jgi:hypothetical protein